MAKGKQQGGKGNPASHRMGNDRVKVRRALSWKRGEERKEARRKAQAEREAVNRQLRREGLPTPWEQAKAKAKAKKEAQ